MRFWDSSALVPLVAKEPSSPSCRALLVEDGDVAVWALTRTEMISAIRRKERSGELPAPATREALRRLTLLETRWTEVDSLPPVRERADRILAIHPLRAADALQLAAALVLTDERPRAFSFVTTDKRLGDAASAEGFEVAAPQP